MGFGFLYDSDDADTRSVTGTQCVLYRGGKWMAIYSGHGSSPVTDASNPEQQDPTLFVGIIQTMLDSIDFSRANTAFLVRQADGSRRLVYSEKYIQVAGKLWAPLIEESAITYDKWQMNGTYRGGLWNGIRVDVTIFVCQDEWDLHWREVEGHRIMQSAGLTELTFEMVGHVTIQGRVVGHVRKAIHGRLVEYRDRSAVYEGIMRMQAKGILYKATTDQNMWIADGGVHFVSLSSIDLYDNNAELEEKAKYWHWERLQDMFNDLKQGESALRCAVWEPKLPSEEIIIPRLPSPGRELSDLPNMSDFIRAYSAFLADHRKMFSWMDDLAVRDFTSTRSPSRHTRSSRNSNKRLKIYGYGHSTDRYGDVSTTEDYPAESKILLSSHVTTKALTKFQGYDPLRQNLVAREQTDIYVKKAPRGK
ncbi:hypothetical protein HWV62_2394 [Athelia sp. TMB]|nr:hypothetical protein HWV62_2394 [Athelia sp. TMB]